jgi:hypothetical protein
MSTQLYTGAQIDFGYLTPYLTYAATAAIFYSSEMKGRIILTNKKAKIKNKRKIMIFKYLFDL